MKEDRLKNTIARERDMETERKMQDKEIERQVERNRKVDKKNKT